MFPNARFNVWINGDLVKITLKNDQSLSWHKWYRTEEGWASESETWSYHNGFVFRESVSDGSDCDGRLTRSHDSICCHVNLRDKIVADLTCAQCGSTLHDWTKIGVLECSNRAHKGIKANIQLFPSWTETKSSQRDYTAEKMGY